MVFHCDPDCHRILHNRCNNRIAESRYTYFPRAPVGRKGEPELNCSDDIARNERYWLHG